MNSSISVAKKKQLFDKLKKANTKFQKIYPGDRSDRQPVHTVYGGANLFKQDSAKVLGNRALEAFKTYAPDFITFGKIFGLEGVHEISAKKSNEAIELYKENLESYPKTTRLSDIEKHLARLGDFK